MVTLFNYLNIAYFQILNTLQLWAPIDTTAITNFLTDMLSFIRDVMTPVASVAVVLCGAMWVFSSDQQTVMTAKKWLFRIILGLAIIWIGPTVLKSLIETLGGPAS